MPLLNRELTIKIINNLHDHLKKQACGKMWKGDDVHKVTFPQLLELCQVTHQAQAVAEASQEAEAGGGGRRRRRRKIIPPTKI